MKNKIKTTLILLFTLSLIASYGNSIADSKSDISVTVNNCSSTNSTSNLAIRVKIDDNKNNWPHSTVINEGGPAKTLSCTTGDTKCYVKCLGKEKGNNKDKTISVRNGDTVYCKLEQVNVSGSIYKWSMKINRNRGCNEF